MHGHHPGEIKLSIYSSTAGDEDAKKLLKKWKTKGAKKNAKKRPIDDRDSCTDDELVTIGMWIPAFCYMQRQLKTENPAFSKPANR